jgi:hypothetical protein
MFMICSTPVQLRGPQQIKPNESFRCVNDRWRDFAFPPHEFRTISPAGLTMTAHTISLAIAPRFGACRRTSVVRMRAIQCAVVACNGLPRGQYGDVFAVKLDDQIHAGFSVKVRTP